MSIVNCNSFVPFRNIKLHYNLTSEPNILNDKVTNKQYNSKEFKHLDDNVFLEKQDMVLNIIEDLREFDNANGTNIFKNILYLNLYDLLYK